MAEKIKKSHFTKKETEKEEKPSEEELKLRKLEEIVQKLKQTVEHKDNYERNLHKESTKVNINNKSNYSSPTTSRLKEDRNDQDFLTTFMYIDDHPNILPKNMHLLTDNDTNQSITPQEKYKNLSNLMLDDKNITELNFIRNTEERIKLNLYTAFSKKSKELFINENNVKQSKNQILFHKINDIHIPKFGFKQTISQNIERQGSINNINEVPESNMDKVSLSENNNQNLNDKKNKNEKDQNNENDELRFNECYFRQEKKGYFHIPSLIKMEPKPPKKKELRKQKTYIGPTKYNLFKKENKIQDETFWDPEIDADTLSYINHNFISIEDIYNGNNLEEKKEKEKNNNDNSQNEENEPNLIPIKAKEIFFENSDNEYLNNFVYDKEKQQDSDHGDLDKIKSENNDINKFIEFIAINPGVIKTQYPIYEKSKKELINDLNLKQDFKNKINAISEIELNFFPRNGQLNAKQVERFLRFKNLVRKIKEIELFLGPKNSTNEESDSLKEINENSELRLRQVDNKDASGDKSLDDITNKKSYLNGNDEFDDSHKNNNSIITPTNKNDLNKYGNKKVFNFNEGNSNHSFSSEKANSVSKNEDDN